MAIHSLSFTHGMLTCCLCIFLCVATRRSYLYLGAILSSALSTMVLLNFINIFFRSTMLYSANLVGN